MAPWRQEAVRVFLVLCTIVITAYVGYFCSQQIGLLRQLLLLDPVSD